MNYSEDVYESLQFNDHDCRGAEEAILIRLQEGRCSRVKLVGPETEFMYRNVAY